MAESADEALSAAGIARKELAGVGIGSPGPLDIDDRPDPFQPEPQRPQFPDRAEARGAAQSARAPAKRRPGWRLRRVQARRGRGYRNLIAVFVGTGIGGCLIQEGRIVAGATGNAGEVGHIILKAGGPKCGCGHAGVWKRWPAGRRSPEEFTRPFERAFRRSSPRRSAQVGKAEKRRPGRGRGHRRPRRHHRSPPRGALPRPGSRQSDQRHRPEIIIIGGGVTVALGEPFLEMVRASAREQALADPAGKIRIVGRGSVTTPESSAPHFGPRAVRGPRLTGVRRPRKRDAEQVGSITPRPEPAKDIGLRVPIDQAGKAGIRPRPLRNRPRYRAGDSRAPASRRGSVQVTPLAVRHRDSSCNASRTGSRRARRRNVPARVKFVDG